MSTKTIKGKKYEVNSSGIHRRVNQVTPAPAPVTPKAEVKPEAPKAELSKVAPLPLPEKPTTQTQHKTNLAEAKEVKTVLPKKEPLKVDPPRARTENNDHKKNQQGFQKKK